MLNGIKKKINKKGFTLVEIVVVIAILGIIAAIAIPKMSSSLNSAKVVTHNANINILKGVATMYLVDYPDAHDSSNDTVLTAGTHETKFKTYFDGGKIPKAYNGTEFTVKILMTGDIEISPSEVHVENGEIKVIGLVTP